MRMSFSRQVVGRAFGLTVVEAMARGLPVVAAAPTGGSGVCCRRTTICWPGLVITRESRAVSGNSVTR